MTKFSIHRAIASLLVAAPGLAAAAGPTLFDIRSELKSLADTLVYQGAMNATYGPILLKASEAYAMVSDVPDDSRLGPRANLLRESLHRLIVESQYFVEESSDPTYVPDPLESHEYLTASVDEWRFTVNYLSENMEEPVCDIDAHLPSIRVRNITHAAEPGFGFRDNALTPVMVVIPTGSYIAGATEEEHIKWNVEPEKWDFEYPQRKVTIDKKLAFSRTEVTVAEFDTFVQLTCYQPRGGARWWDKDAVENFVFSPELSYLKPGFPQTPHHPVVAITRYDAQAYAHWLSQITGAKYRLPTEDEWEWAARGGADTTFFWGDELTQAYQYANTYDNSAAAANRFRWPSNNMTDGFPYTAVVASFKPNGFGLFDMTGNAREFMADNWQKNLTTSPNNGEAHEGPAPFVTVRGGAWNYNPKNLRLNYRSGYMSSEVATNMFGIRLVRELDCCDPPLDTTLSYVPS